MKTEMKTAEDPDVAVLAEQSRFLTSFGMTSTRDGLAGGDYSGIRGRP